MLELRKQYSDFQSYEERIATLAGVFLPGKAVTIRRYLEGLYVVAKHEAEHSTTTPSAAKTPNPSGSR